MVGFLVVVVVVVEGGCIRSGLGWVVWVTGVGCCWGFVAGLVVVGVLWVVVGCGFVEMENGGLL